jgi:hypothetical protein
LQMHAWWGKLFLVSQVKNAVWYRQQPPPHPLFLQELVVLAADATASGLEKSMQGLVSSSCAVDRRGARNNSEARKR